MTATSLTTTKLDAEHLSEIAERIRDRVRRTVDDIIAIGQDLAQVKATMPHGEFTAWIDAEFSMTDRTAQKYMRAAEWTEGKTELSSVLQPSALYLLSAKSTPKDVQAEVVADLKAGKPVKPREIETKVKQAKAARKAPAPSDGANAESEPKRSPGDVAFSEFQKALVTSRSLWSTAASLDLFEIDDKHRRLILEVLDTAEQEIADTIGRIRAKLVGKP